MKKEDSFYCIFYVSCYLNGEYEKDYLNNPRPTPMERSTEPEFLGLSFLNVVTSEVRIILNPNFLCFQTNINSVLKNLIPFKRRQPSVT